MEPGTQDESRQHGVFDSVRGMCGAALGLVQNRLELIGVELQEQKERFIRVVLLAAGLIFLGNMAALVVTYTIVVIADTAKKPVLIILSVLYVAAAVITFLWLRKELRAGPPPLSETVSELKKDRDWINSPK